MNPVRGLAATARQVRSRPAAGIIVPVIAFILLPSLHAAAQTYGGGAAPRMGTMEISGGAVWIGGYDAGDGAATETSNSSTGGSPITLFTTDARVPGTTGIDARVAFYLGSRVAAEGLFQYSKPEVNVRADDDFENALPENVVGGYSSYLFGGSLVYHFGSGKVVPFVLGGAGYMRLLDEDNAEVVTGSELHGGGGVKVSFSEGRRGFGLRVDAQASVRNKNPGFEEKRRVLPSVAAALLYRF